MKKLFLFAATFCLLVSFALAQEVAPVTTPTTVTPEATEITLSGTIVDNQCASAQEPVGLADFVKTHTKQCMLVPECVASGYSIFSEGKLTKFDKVSNVKIEEFLRQENSKPDVTVVVNKVGEELSLVSIRNKS